MWQTKLTIFAIATLMTVGSAVAIIGGQDAAPGQFPYFVLIQAYKTPNAPRTIRQSCGGAFILNDWIVTNAKCLVDSEGAEVHLGIQNLDDRNESSRQIFNVVKKDYHIHPSYQKGQPYFHDIALIKLPSPAEYTKYIQPITLSDSIVPINIGKDAITMGYGLKNLIIDGIPEHLQYTKFKLTDLQTCAPNTWNSIRKYSMVCGNVIQGRLCHGDMGGPLVSPESGKLIGIAISSTWHDCEVNRPQSFIAIKSYNKWIASLIFVFSQTRLEF